MSFNPYGAPSPRAQQQWPPHGGHPYGWGQPPQSLAAIGWFRAFAAFMAVMYLLLAALGVWMQMFLKDLDPAFRNDPNAVVMPIIFIVMGVPLAIFYVVATFIPRAPWGWVVGMIALCIGISGCTVVAALPLLLAWNKPHLKAAFGKH